MNSDQPARPFYYILVGCDLAFVRAGFLKQLGVAKRWWIAPPKARKAADFESRVALASTLHFSEFCRDGSLCED